MRSSRRVFDVVDRQSIRYYCVVVVVVSQSLRVHNRYTRGLNYSGRPHSSVGRRDIFVVIFRYRWAETSDNLHQRPVTTLILACYARRLHTRTDEIMARVPSNTRRYRLLFYFVIPGRRPTPVSKIGRTFCFYDASSSGIAREQRCFRYRTVPPVQPSTVVWKNNTRVT